MEHVKFDSTAIDEVFYSNRRRTLLMRYRKGGLYKYLNVSRQIFDELVNADSKGIYWNSMKAQFECIHLE